MLKINANVVDDTNGYAGVIDFPIEYDSVVKILSNKRRPCIIRKGRESLNQPALFGMIKKWFFFFLFMINIVLQNTSHRQL